jgi:hypothetical protein
MTEAVSTGETWVYFYYTTRLNIPEDSHLHFINIQSKHTWCLAGKLEVILLISDMDNATSFYVS